jgi:hypothetical protein
VSAERPPVTGYPGHVAAAGQREAGLLPAIRAARLSPTEALWTL